MQRIGLATVAMVALAVACAASAAGADVEAPTLRDLSVEQASVANLKPPAPTPASATQSLNVTAWVDQEDNAYALGEAVRIFVRTNLDAYVTILNVGASGQTTILFPNQYQTENFVRAERSIQVPAPGSAGRIVATAPAGVELIKVIATSKPGRLINSQNVQQAGVFSVVNGGARTAVRDLAVALNAEAADEAVLWDSYDKVIRTHAATTGGVSVPQQAPVSAPGATDAAAGVSANEPSFGLLLRVAKPIYRVGETVEVEVESQQDCYLTLVNIRTNGQVRVLFPNQVAQQNRISAGQVLQVPAPGSPLRIRVEGPAGLENIVAVCSKQAQPVFGDGYDFAQGFPAVGGREAASRDLQLVSETRPQGTVTQAAIAFLVTE